MTPDLELPPALLIALSLMPIAGAMAINFSAPLFATLFAALWLKEKVGRARAAAPPASRVCGSSRWRGSRRGRIYACSTT